MSVNSYEYNKICVYSAESCRRVCSALESKAWIGLSERNGRIGNNMDKLLKTCSEGIRGNRYVRATSSCDVMQINVMSEAK